MIYRKESIDMSLVSCSYEEEHEYVYISDEYTNNILKLAGHNDINDADYHHLCCCDIFSNYLYEYALRSPKYAYIYAHDVLDGKFINGETIISKSPKYSFLYAMHILKGRFELAESTISRNAEYSFLYARYVLKGRFELGEYTIAEDGEYSFLYHREFFESVTVIE